PERRFLEGVSPQPQLHPTLPVEESPRAAGPGDDRPRRGRQPRGALPVPGRDRQQVAGALGEALGPGRDRQYQERRGGGAGGGGEPSNVDRTVSRTVADFLKQEDLPWPIQLRGLEAMGWLRQGALPTDPSRAHMANSAMGFLADTEAKLEVRSEAARALGLMQVNAVPRYNFRLVA